MISSEDRRARACSELRRGAPVVLTGAGQAPVVAASAEMLTGAMWRSLTALIGGGWVLAVSDRRAETLKAWAYDGDLARIHVAHDAEAAQLRAIADPAMDLERPLSGPHRTAQNGEATLHRQALTLCKRARLLPAALVAPLPVGAAAEAFAAEHGLCIAEAAPEPSVGPAVWREASAARVPIAVAPNTRLRVFRRDGWEDEHYALEIGAPSRDAPVLVRLHSACVTGDLFGSLKCDCGAQLQAALEMMAKAGGGVLLYLLQEGRGIGLANKMRAYKLQDDGFDTVEANHRLGFQDDERLLADGGEILCAMGFSKARLITNNPAKITALTDVGLTVVERVPLVMPTNPENISYLAVKAAKSGHLL